MSLSSGLSEEVSDEEHLGRFLRSKRYVAKTTGVIKPAAFLPAPDNDTSVFRLDSLSEDETRELAAEHVGELSKNGTATVQAAAAFQAGLQVTPKEPPHRHANIHGWPSSSDPDAQKRERKTLAALLAAEAEWLPSSA